MGTQCVMGCQKLELYPYLWCLFWKHCRFTCTHIKPYLYLPLEQCIPAIKLVKCLSRPVSWMMGAEQPIHWYLLVLGHLACHVQRVVVNQIPEVMHSQSRGWSGLEWFQSTYHLPSICRQSSPCISFSVSLQNVYWSWGTTWSTPYKRLQNQLQFYHLQAGNSIS
jgi:hypothetical protein